MEEQERIRVPMLQRDFAQGRADQSDVRDEFLAALEQALKRPSDDPELPLNLDFIYGSAEGGSNGSTFAPLDGQQRLTTLFLLHWFLAWQDGAWTQFGHIFRSGDGGSRFTYKVRQSSSEFFDKLVTFQPQVSSQEVLSVAALITDQPWYFRHWRLDPTVQSVLTMLDAIHARFKESTGLFGRLTDTQKPAITFQLLLLENFGLSDDLYIKMNARGKPLTAFENFKAQYEHSLAAQFEGQNRTVSGHAYPVAKFVALRMDTAWADFFWPHRDRVTNLCDDVMMNLFRVLALVTRDPESRAYATDVALLRDEARPASYAAFRSHGWLHEGFTEAAIALLEAWSAQSKDQPQFRPLLPNTRYFDEAGIFEKIRGNSVSLTLTEVTQFAGYVHFIRLHTGAIATSAFQEWMRVVRNLAVNTPIERADQLRTAAQGIGELLPHAAEILSYLSKHPLEARVQGFYQPQVQEEQTKAGLILGHDGWRPLIERAEQHGYFVGQIDFLCEFSGANAKRKSAPDFQWGDEAHLGIQKQFAFYLTHAEAMFSAHGLKDSDQHLWQRALLVIGDYLLPSGQNHSLLVDAITEPASWKRLLRTSTFEDSSEIRNRPLLKTLWDRLDHAAPLMKQLDAVIANASGLPAWRESLVRTPVAIEYCGRRALRRSSETDIMLLSKSTMRGDHVEIFTYCLYNMLRTTIHGQSIKPLAIGNYVASNDSSTLPDFRLSFTREHHTVVFIVEFVHGAFRIQVPESPLRLLPVVGLMLTEQAGFVPFGDGSSVLMKRIPFQEIIEQLANLAKLIATLPPESSPS